MNHEGSKGGEVDHADAVGLSLLKFELGAESIVDDHVVRDRGREASVGRKQHVLYQRNSLRVVPASN